MVRTVAVLGAAHDPHVRELATALTALRANVIEIDVNSGPSISLGEEISDVRVSGRPVRTPDAVFVRAVSSIAQSQAILGMLQRWEHCGSRLYNSPWDAHFISKPYQMSLLRENGIPIVPIVWASDLPGAVHARDGSRLFGESEERRWSLASTCRGDLAIGCGSGDASSSAHACTDELRVLVMDGEVLSCERVHIADRKILAIEPVVHDEELHRTSLRVARLLRMPLVGVYLRRDATDGHRVVDVDPSPHFLGVWTTPHDEAISASIARLMMTERRPRSIVPGTERENLLRTRVEVFEMTLLQRALEEAHGNQAVAAERLGIPLRTLVHKISKYRLRHVDQVM